jgi:hypothetical protein
MRNATGLALPFEVDAPAAARFRLVDQGGSTRHQRNLPTISTVEHKPRTTYVVDLLHCGILRNKQRQALRLSSGAWDPAAHPELVEGGAAYVDSIRSEPDERFEAAIENGNR